MRFRGSGLAVLVLAACVASASAPSEARGDVVTVDSVAAGAPPNVAQMVRAELAPASLVNIVVRYDSAVALALKSVALNPITAEPIRASASPGTSHRMRVDSLGTTTALSSTSYRLGVSARQRLLRLRHTTAAHGRTRARLTITRASERLQV